MGWAAVEKPVLGLLSCSGSCVDATLSKRAAIRTMGDNPDEFIDIWYTASSLGLAYGDSIAVSASIQDLKNSFKDIVAIEGCKTACATKLLTDMGFKPAKIIYLSDKYKDDEKVGITLEEDIAIDNCVPDIVAKIVEITTSEKETPNEITLDVKI